VPQTVGYPAESITSAHAEAAERLWDDFVVGKDFRKTREKLWKRSERQYQGKTWRNAAEDPTTDLININMSFSTINTIMPHLTGMAPEFIVVPFSADSTTKNARIQEAFLNRMWRHKPVGAQAALKSAVWDYLVYGDGYLKTTFQIVERINDPDSMTSIVETYVDRVSPWDVWIDPNSTGLDKARWVTMRLYMTEDEARQDETFQIPASFEFTTVDPTELEDDSGDKPTGSSIAGGDRKWVVLYEMYDITNQIMYVVPESGDKRPWKIVEGVELPIEQIPGYTIPQSPYHIGDLEQIFDLQMELDKTRSQQIAHRRRNVSKVFVRDDALSPEAESALRSSVVGEMIPIKGEVPLADLVQPMQLPALPSESYSAAEQATRDIGDITGITEYQRGSAPTITRTATEAQMMQGSSNVKIDAKLDTVEFALRNVGEYMLAIAREVYPDTDVDEMAMFIGGAEGRAINQLQAGDETQDALQKGDLEGAEAIASTAGLFGEATISPSEEIFVGNYEVLVEHSSTDAINPRMKSEKFQNVLMTMAQLQPQLAQTGTNVDLTRLARLWLESENIPGVDAILGGAPPPPPPPEEGQGAPGGEPGEQGMEELMGMLGGAGGAPGAEGAGEPVPMGMGEGDPLAMEQPGGMPPQGSPGDPGTPLSADNTGALDPADYPIVGKV
jgi:hypothetical protein